jgi:[protein-PII] uridylyltransferase
MPTAHIRENRSKSPRPLIGSLPAQLARIAAASEPGAHQRNEITTTAVQALHELWENATARAEISQELVGKLTLVGVGSLGRADMGSRSDLDLLLVHEPQAAQAAQALAPHLWYPIWDAGLDLDHSVRSLKQCRTIASTDLPAAVGMLSVRPIAGDPNLAFETSSLVLADWRSAARTRLPELIESARARTQRHGELAHQIEPDLKECRGGLRDAVLLDALAATWIADRPHGDVDQARAELLNARDAVQRVTGRHANRLFLSDLEEVAQVCGWDNTAEYRAHLGECGRTISYALDTTIRRVQTALATPQARAKTLLIRGKRSAPRLRSVAEGIVEHNNELVLLADSRTRNDPVLPLRTAATSVRTGIPISPSALPSLAACPELPLPWPQSARAAFLHLIGSGPAQIPVWEALDLAGIVSAWIPEWRKVRNKVQHSAAHRHTVDRHLIEVVSRVHPWRKELKDPAVLMLGALFHDIGKQEDVADHSLFGAERIPAILGPMGFDSRTQHDVALLVRHHLLLSELATTTDPDSDEPIERLVEALEGKRDLLVALRAITEADAASLATDKWTTWRATLVDNLFQRAKPHMKVRS